MTPCCGEASSVWGGRAGGSPWRRDTTHKATPPPPCLWPRWVPETTHAATGQRGVSWLHASVQVCLQVKALPQAHKLSQNGKPGGPPGGTPRMGSPTVANTKERAQTFHARMLPFLFC